MKPYISPKATLLQLLPTDIITISWVVEEYDEDQNAHNYWDLNKGSSGTY